MLRRCFASTRWKPISGRIIFSTASIWPSPRGGLTMLIGRNGAGKTTTLRTIMGLWQASAGSITFDGKTISGRQTPDIARAGIAYVPETMAVFSELTVKENLILAAREGDIDAARLRWIFGLFPGA